MLQIDLRGKHLSKYIRSNDDWELYSHHKPQGSWLSQSYLLNILLLVSVPEANVFIKTSRSLTIPPLNWTFWPFLHSQNVCKSVTDCVTICCLSKPDPNDMQTVSVRQKCCPVILCTYILLSVSKVWIL